MIRKILVVVDERPVSPYVIGQAIDMAQAHRADIFFLGVMPQYDYSAADQLSVVDMLMRELHDRALNDTSRLLAAASARAERCGINSHHAISAAFDAVQEVADAAIKRHCDLIVVGTDEQSAFVRLFSSGIAPRLISKSTVPVLICREISSSNRRQYPQRPLQRSPWRHKESGPRSGDALND